MSQEKIKKTGRRMAKRPLRAEVRVPKTISFKLDTYEKLAAWVDQQNRDVKDRTFGKLSVGEVLEWLAEGFLEETARKDE